MVKMKGFTLIEIMVVIAIVGILLSVAVGSMKNRNQHTPAYDTESDNTSNTILINGVEHSCDSQGECTPTR